LHDLAELTEDGFRERFRASPVKRAKFAGFHRNVANAVKNISR
jgi:epoxyqueuosine reductase QueG